MVTQIIFKNYKIRTVEQKKESTLYHAFNICTHQTGW